LPTSKDVVEEDTDADLHPGGRSREKEEKLEYGSHATKTGKKLLSMNWGSRQLSELALLID